MELTSINNRGDSVAYELFCQSMQGAGHIKKGMPCEDYGIKFENDNCKIFALGDGHGDANCPRSSYGSRSICEIAVDELQLFAKEIKNQNWECNLFDCRESKKLITQLITSVFGKWSCKVNEDFSQNPLTEQEELAAKDYIDRYQKGERIEHVYGTTFIAGLLTDTYLLLLQQGDGRCVVFDQEGNASQPIPWDDRCFANVTTSVCDIDAVQSCRYHIIDLEKNAVIACVIGSDGVEDSFGSMDKMYVYYREKLQIACELGVDKLEEHFVETLPSFSAEGSQDDITICGIIDRTLFKDKLAKIIEDNQAVIVNDAIFKAQEHINSMQPKLEFLSKRCAEIETQYSILKKKYSHLEEEYKNIKMDIDALQNDDLGTPTNIKAISFSASSIKCLQRRLHRIIDERDELVKEIQSILDKKKVYDDEYEAYKEKYDSFVKMKQKYEGKQLLDDSIAMDEDIQEKIVSDEMPDDQDAPAASETSNENNQIVSNEEGLEEQSVDVEKNHSKNIDVDLFEVDPLTESDISEDMYNADNSETVETSSEIQSPNSGEKEK